MGKVKKSTSEQRRGTGKNNNGNPDKIKGQGFHTNPERINRQGRPPKLLKHVLADLKAQGIEKVTSAEIVDLYQSLINCDEAKAQQIMNDKKAPFVLRKLVAMMSSDKFLDVFDRLIDRSFGKVSQKFEIVEAEAPEPANKPKSAEEILAAFDEKMKAIDMEFDAKENPPVNEGNESLL